MICLALSGIRVLRTGIAVVAFSSFALTSRAGEVNFERDVRPIFQKSCSGCHFPEAESLKAKLDLSTVETALKGSADGPVILPGKADESPLVQAVEFKAEPHMPPEGKGVPLTPEAIAVLRQWINEGAQAGPAVEPVSVAEERSQPTPTASTHAAAITALAYAPPSSEPLLARGTLHRVDVLTIDPATGATAPKYSLGGHAEMVRALAFSPDGSVLAAGGGLPGRRGEVKLWNVAEHRLLRTLEGHKDNVLGLAFSPDGKRLASCSYDKTVIVWDVHTGEQVHQLKNHVDAVYAVAYSPDGSLIASGAGDRTVKIWDAKPGNLLSTISDSLDSVLALTFSPSGDQLAGAGADKMIRIWDMKASEGPFQQSATTSGVLLRSTFAHDGAVLQLAYAPDGKTLYSASEDLRIKAWNTDTLEEKLTFEPQSDWVTSLAVSPDGAYVAVGRYDASSSIYASATAEVVSADSNEDSGAVAKVSSPDTPSKPDGAKKITSLSVDAVIIEATVPPSITSIAPVRWQRGSEVEVTVNGKNLDRAEPILTNAKIGVEVVSSEALPMPNLKLGEGPRGLGADILDNARPYRVKLKFTIPEDAPVGNTELMFRTPIGMTNPTAFNVLPVADTGETEPNDSDDNAQAVEWPTVIIGQVAKPGDVDRYRVALKAGQDIVCAVTDSALNTSMRLLDAAGVAVATNQEFNDPGNNRLGYHAETDGDFILELSDADLRGGLGYRLHIGAFPMVTRVWPLGAPAGDPHQVHITGFNLGTGTVEVDPPDEASYGATVPIPLPRVAGNPIAAPFLAVGAYPEVVESEPNNAPDEAQRLAFPSTVNGRIDGDSDGDQDLYEFTAQRGQTLILEVQAAQLGSPLDSVIEILDTRGNLLQRGEVRCVAETFLTLSPRDSRSGGLRLDSWRDLRVNDDVMVGGEIVRVAKIPDYADEDVVLKTYPNGQRIAMYGTTPEQHAVNTKVYKVELSPPNTTFAPNGMPVFPLYWRNDDGFTANGETKGDSKLAFIAPEDGTYLVRVTDAAGAWGEAYAYRLTVRPPQPDFEVSVGPYRVNVAKGGRVPIDVRVLRRDGFDGDVNVAFHDLPQGFSIQPDVIPAGEDLVRLALVTGTDAHSTPFDARFRLTAEAVLNGVSVVREGALGPITVSEVRPDLVVESDKSQVALAPGKAATISVKLERFNGFSSRVPIDVLNLPFGVRVMNTGLNGILVRDGEYERTIELYAEPWVITMDRRIYVQAQIETQSPQRPLFVGEPIDLHISDQLAKNEEASAP